MPQHATRRPAELTALDPAAEQVGGVYARALLGATEQQKQTEAVLSELDSFVSDVLGAFPRLDLILGSALISPEEKGRTLDRILSGRASPLFLNFMKVLAEHGRLNALRAIRRVAHVLYDELRRRVKVEVITAAPLDPELSGRIVERMRQMLGEEPRLEQVVDPAVIGGLVLRVGDTIYDGSVATRLARMREHMIERSVHEIQRGRDRFSHSAGN